MTVITLKYYQQEAVDVVKKEFKAGVSSQLIVLPTGTGKTYLMAGIAKELNRPTLIIAHREELITQNADKIRRYWPDADIGICKAGRNELDHQIVIGSVQTCSQPKRLQQLKEKGFNVLMIDEAHHSPSKSYKKIIAKLGFNGKKKLLIGVTATPERNDKLGMLDVYEKIIYAKSISEMIDGGHLVPVSGRRILTSTSLAGVEMHAGDFAAGSLANAINTPARNNFIAQKFVAHAYDRKAVAFCANVQHTQDLAEAFNKHGIKAAAVWGSMPTLDRQTTLNSLRDGALQVVTSCGILTEGYDEETISCIIMARPTKSKGLYIQCVGRGLRKPNDPASTKKDCLVLDFTDNYHKIDTIMTLRKAIPCGVDIVDKKKE